MTDDRERLMLAILEFENNIKKETAKEIKNWSKKWFEEKAKDNTMWKLNQQELTDLFLEELKNR